MARWTFDRFVETGGRFNVIITKHGTGRRGVDFVRWVPAEIQSYSNADPFGDSTAVINFPAVTAFDEPTSGNVGEWLGDFSDVDIWWVTSVNSKPAGWDDLVVNPYWRDYHPWTDPLTNETLYAPAWEYTISGGVVTRGNHRGVKVWEGFIASWEVHQDSSGSGLTIQCQGALYQLDRYLQKPFYPARPQTLESLIQDAFAHDQRPNLRTKPVKIMWPTGWTKVAPPYPKNGATIFTPNVAPGMKWTGYSSRNTGSWDHCLTSFIQDNLSVMITQNNSGVTPGNQWTLLQERQDPDPNHHKPGRVPILTVRDRFADPAFSIWTGQPGVELQLTRDSTQMANVVYGDGTSIDGTVWRNAVITGHDQRTDYLPLAADRRVYPPRDNKHFDRHRFVSEAYVKYGTGFDQTSATVSAQKTLQRDLDPGWSGTITLSLDPDADTSRFTIQAGTSLLLKGFMGTGSTGMLFHIASADISAVDGTVTMQVDTRFRDLLNLEEAIARNRDPLTPAKLLQVNRTSAKVEDIMAPWDYSMGSGFVPRASKEMEKHKPKSIVFPYQKWTQQNPPHQFPQFYIRVNADATDSRWRWTRQAIPVLMSEKGSISHSEFCAYDRSGHVLAVPFHVSVYQNAVTWRDMPFDTVDGQLVYSPFIHGAFESINPDTGFEWSKGSTLAPDPSILVGWGNYLSQAGYSPGRDVDGAQVTGKLIDDSSWDYDCTNNPNFDRYAKPGWSNQQISAMFVYVMIYCERNPGDGDVWFRGRFFHANPGT